MFEKLSTNQRPRVRSWPCRLHESEIRGQGNQRFSLSPRRFRNSLSPLRRLLLISFAKKNQEKPLGQGYRIIGYYYYSVVPKRSQSASLNIPNFILLYFFNYFKTSFVGLNSNIILQSLKKQPILQHDNRSRVLKPFSWLILVFVAKFHFIVFYFQQKNVSSFFFSLALDLCLDPFSRWASLAYRLLSLFLCFFPALYFKLVNITINLS